MISRLSDELAVIEGDIPLTPGEKIVGEFATEISFVPYNGFSPARAILTSYRVILYLFSLEKLTKCS